MKSTKNFNPGHYIQFKGNGFTLESINWLGGFDTPYLSMIAQAIKDTGIGGLTNPDSVPWQETEKPMYKIMSQFSKDISIAFGGDASQLEKPG